jgi:opacity protein-like surface antigen
MTGLRAAVALSILIGITLIPNHAHAQRSGDGFFFKQPGATLTLHGGLAFADAASDLFAFTTRELTLGRGDFNGPALGLDLGIRLHSRVDLVLSGAYAGTKATSEFRDWVDLDDLPIEQTTSFRRVPLTASLKAYLTPRGRSIGRFAWIPALWAPYIGAGGGAVWYRFKQRGDFVDFNTLDIFYDHISSAGWTGTVHALAGIDFSLSPRWAITTEGRYARASADLGRAFENFEPIDLSGFSTTFGIQLRF